MTPFAILHLVNLEAFTSGSGTLFSTHTKYADEKKNGNEI